MKIVCRLLVSAVAFGLALVAFSWYGKADGVIGWVEPIIYVALGSFLAALVVLTCPKLFAATPPPQRS